jgi:hypothetical protein
MKIIKKIQGGIQDMSIPGAMLLSGLIVGLSIFLTTWIFFGGYNNRQKLMTPNPANAKKAVQTNSLTPQQIQQIQQQRATQTPAPTTPAVKPTATTTKK